jgi:hypothetical protein
LPSSISTLQRSAISSVVAIASGHGRKSAATWAESFRKNSFVSKDSFGSASVLFVWTQSSARWLSKSSRRR